MKVDITHLAMEIDFQSSDHDAAMEKVAEEHLEQRILHARVFKL